MVLFLSLFGRGVRGVSRRFDRGERVVVPGVVVVDNRELARWSSWLVLQKEQPVQVASDRQGQAGIGFEEGALDDAVSSRNGRKLRNQPEFWEVLEGYGQHHVMLTCAPEHMALVQRALANSPRDCRQSQEGV